MEDDLTSKQNKLHTYAAPGTVLQPVNMLPDAGTSVTMKRSYFNSCLGGLIESLILSRPPPHSTDKELQTDLYLTLSYSLTSIIFLLLSDKIQGKLHRIKVTNKDVYPDVKMASYLQNK